MTTRQETGRRGEDLVAERLEREGFRILARNVRVGRLELDLVAYRSRMLVFCEVRTRSTSELVEPFDTIDAAKRQRIRDAALGWLSRQRLAYDEIRFDAASVILGGATPSIDYYEEAF